MRDPSRFTVAPATPADVPQLLALIRALAAFERLTHLVECTEARLHVALFAPQPAVEALLAWERNETADRYLETGKHARGLPGAGAESAIGGVPAQTQGPGDYASNARADAAGFALFFHNYSTFLGRRGLYLEDLYVRPECRGRGCGTALLLALARIASERDCGRFEWSVLDWNVQAQRFYQGLGAAVLPDWRIVRLTGEGIARLAARHDGTRA